MKKVIMGGIVFLGGIIASALIVSSCVQFNMMIDNGWSWMWVLTSFHLEAPLIICIALSVAGLVLGIIGTFEKK